MKRHPLFDEADVAARYAEWAVDAPDVGTQTAEVLRRARTGVPIAKAAADLWREQGGPPGRQRRPDANAAHRRGVRPAPHEGTGKRRRSDRTQAASLSIRMLISLKSLVSRSANWVFASSPCRISDARC